MSAESPLNAAEPAEESTVEPVIPASWPMSALVRDEITERSSRAACRVNDKIEDSVRR